MIFLLQKTATAFYHHNLIRIHFLCAKDSHCTFSILYLRNESFFSWPSNVENNKKYHKSMRA